MHHNIVDGHRRQVRHALPVLPAVERDEQPALRARVQQVQVARVFAHDEHIRFVGQPVGQRLPSLAAVGRLIQVGLEVVEHVAVKRDIGDVRARAGGFHMRDGRVRRQVRHIAGQFNPSFAVVRAFPEASVVRADPQQPLLYGRLRKADNRAVVLGGGVFYPHGTARVFLLFGVVGGQVGANDRPSGSEVGGLEDHIPADIHGVGVVGRGDDRCVPVEAVLEFAGGTAVAAARLRADVLLHTCRQVRAQDVAPLRLADDEARVAGVDEAVESVAEADHAPVFVDDAAFLGARPAHPTAVVLQSARHLVEGRLCAAVYLIELPQRDIGDHIPILPAIERVGKPAVVAVP
jgi:hypothetical protein